MTHFGLTDSSLTAGLLEVLSTSPLTPRLRVLDLSRGSLRGGDVDALIARRLLPPPRAPGSLGEPAR